MLTCEPCKPQRIQRQRVKGWKMPPNTVYVGRGSRWGNPFVVGQHGTAAECVAKYARHMLPYSRANMTLDAFLISESNLEAMAHELRGKNLACWCKPGEPCHADWLLEQANSDAAACMCCT